MMIAFENFTGMSQHDMRNNQGVSCQYQIKLIEIFKIKYYFEYSVNDKITSNGERSKELLC